MQHFKGFLGLVQDAKTRIQETDSKAVKKMLDDKQSIVLIDVREEEEFEQAHIPNAKHLCKGIIERDIEKAVPDHNKKIVLYCGGGYRSALAADNLTKMGYQDVWSMDGGFKAWSDADYP